MRRHLSYANVTATLALVFAMSGGALAASRYTITSTSQIKPSVLAKLKGARGPAGPEGKIGYGVPGVGYAGAEGKQGVAGTDGAQGATGRAGLESYGPCETLPRIAFPKDALCELGGVWWQSLVDDNTRAPSTEPGSGWAIFVSPGTGPTGATGSTGLKGSTGATGATGPTGP